MCANTVHYNKLILEETENSLKTISHRYTKDSTDVRIVFMTAFVCRHVLIYITTFQAYKCVATPTTVLHCTVPNYTVLYRTALC